MSESKANIPSNYSRLIAHELKLSLAGLPKLLVGTGLMPEQLLREDTLITAQQQLLIMRNALNVSAQPGFGLRLGQRLIPSTHGAVGFMAFSSRDLSTALRALQAFLPTRISFANLIIEEANHYLECWVEFSVEMDQEVRQSLAETFLVVFFKLAEFIVARQLSEVVTEFDYPAPEYLALYEEVLPGRVNFSADRLGVRIPIATSLEPNASANHENYLLAMKQCNKQLLSLETDKESYQFRVEKMLLEHPAGQLNEDEVAIALFMSKRSLARRLKAEGTGFREIRDRLLSEQAENYLAESSLSVEAIATLLGYHDSANFRRAFKRWFGIGPAEYRLSARAG